MILLLGLFGGLLLLGVPIAFAMLGSALVVIWIEGFPLSIFAQRVSSGIQNFPLLAIPLFILTGNLMNQSGMSERLFDFARALVGHVRGGLAHVNVLASVFMSGISGSSLADAAATTRVFVPQMIRAGFGRGFSVALTAASATLAPIIPPSILLIIYGWQANVSIGDLFVAGIGPGLFIGAVLLGLTAILTRVYGYPRGDDFSGARLWTTFKRAAWALLLPVLVVGGFRAGIFTATEVASIAAVYALVVGAVVYRTLTPADLYAALVSTGKDTASILILVAAASPFAWILALHQAPQAMLGFVTAISDDPIVVMLLLNLMLLVIGMFMETLTIIIILVPVLLPLLNLMGVDLVHFGIILVFNLLIGQLTPPIGVLMFVTCSIARLRMATFVKEIWPFLVALGGALLVIAFVPGLSLGLVHLLR